MSALYRVEQFFRAARSWVRTDKIDDTLAARHLTPPALSLFAAMPRYDRHHAANVLRTLQALGESEPDLMAAALLHDVGKTALPGSEMRLWHRVVVVLMRSLCPGALVRVGEGRKSRWRRPFFVQQHHAAISAEMAQAAGCSVRAVDLIRRHEIQ